MTNLSNRLSLESMRTERQVFEAIFIQFANSTRYYKTHAFCFYEGEDGKYYDSRIRDEFKDKFITYKVGNKKEVLRLMERIRRGKQYGNLCTMFFIDHDYDESNMEHYDDLFETPCYSIENFYVQKSCLEKILQSEFGINSVDADYERCLQDFAKREIEFNDCILEFNTLAYLRRRKSDANRDFSLSSIKTSSLVHVSVDQVEKTNRYEQIISRMREGLNLNNIDEIEKTKAELITRGNFSCHFRGKNQLDFFVAFIKDLKSKNMLGGYFTKKYNGVKIDITANRLSELSQYATTPSSLTFFLKEHRAKLEKIGA